MRESEPRLLREQAGSALERALLEAGTSCPASSGRRTKTLAALGLTGSASLLAGGAASASSVATPSSLSWSSFSSWAKLGWSKVVVGVSLAGAVTLPVGYYALQHRQEPRDRREGRGPGAAPTVIYATEHPAPEAPAAPALRWEDVTDEPAERPSMAAPAPRARAASGSSNADAHLRDELVAIDRARQALVAGDASAALTTLERYAKAHPHGRLEIEAEVLRIDALARSGRDDLARPRALAFLKNHPHNVLAPRVRAHLDDSSSARLSGN